MVEISAVEDVMRGMSRDELREVAAELRGGGESKAADRVGRFLAERDEAEERIVSMIAIITKRRYSRKRKEVLAKMRGAETGEERLGLAQSLREMEATNGG